MTLPDEPRSPDVPGDAETGPEANITGTARAQAVSTLTLPPHMQAAVPVPAGWPSLFNAQAMQDAIMGFLEVHKLTLDYNQMNGLMAAFVRLGERYNQLALRQPELDERAQAALAPVRASIGPEWRADFADYCNVLEGLLWKILNQMQEGGIDYLMDTEGFRKEPLVEDFEALMNHLHAANKRFLHNPPAHLTVLAQDISIDAGPKDQAYAELFAATRAVFTNTQPDDFLKPVLSRHGIDPDRGLSAVQALRTVAWREAQFVNTQDLTDVLIEQWLIEAFEAGLTQEAIPTETRQAQLLFLVKRLISHQSTIANQVLASLRKSSPDPKSEDDPLGTRVFDYGNTAKQPNERLANVEWLLCLTGTVLRTLDTVLKVKAYV